MWSYKIQRYFLYYLRYFNSHSNQIDSKTFKMPYTKSLLRILDKVEVLQTKSYNAQVTGKLSYLQTFDKVITSEL